MSLSPDPTRLCDAARATIRIKLSRAILKQGVDVNVFTSQKARLHNRHESLYPDINKWSIVRMFYLVKKIRQSLPRIVHIQYPTIDYGYHLGPQALLILLRLLGQKVITTIHEFQMSRIPRGCFCAENAPHVDIIKC